MLRPRFATRTPKDLLDTSLVFNPSDPTVLCGMGFSGISLFSFFLLYLIRNLSNAQSTSLITEQSRAPTIQNKAPIDIRKCVLARSALPDAKHFLFFGQPEANIPADPLVAAVDCLYEKLTPMKKLTRDFRNFKLEFYKVIDQHIKKLAPEHHLKLAELIIKTEIKIENGKLPIDGTHFSHGDGRASYQKPFIKMGSLIQHPILTFYSGQHYTAKQGEQIATNYFRQLFEALPLARLTEDPRANLTPRGNLKR